MSILTNQCALLRTLADKLRNVHAREGDDYIESCETLFWSMGAMREAADTIESLRERLQDVRGECEVVSVKGRPSGSLEVRYSCGHMVIMQRGETRSFCPYCGKAVKR